MRPHEFKANHLSQLGSAGGNIAQRSTPSPSDKDKLIEAFFAPDPVEGNEAAMQLSAFAWGIIQDLVVRQASPGRNDPWLGRRFRKLMSGWRPQEPEVLDHLSQVLAQGNWWAQLVAAQAFDGLSTDNERLYSLLADKNSDVVLAAIKAAGHLGAVSYCAPIYEVTTSSCYNFQKYNGFALEAFSRMIIRASEARQVETCLHWIEAILFPQATSDLSWLATAEHSLSSSWESNISWRFHYYSLAAIDVLVSRWLGHEKPLFRRLGVEALGAIKVRRVVPQIRELITNPDENAEVVHSAGFALADIGGFEAAEAVREAIRVHGLNSEKGSKLVFAYAQLVPDDPALIKDTDSFETIRSAEGSEEQGQLFYSLAIIRHPEARPWSEKSFAADEPSTRGIAALAYARCLGDQAVNELRERRREASNYLEHIFMASAQVAAGDIGVAAELHERLSTASRPNPLYRLRYIWQREILFTLTAAGEFGQSAAEAWAVEWNLDLARACNQMRTFLSRSGSRPSSPTMTPRQVAATPADDQPVRSVFISYSHDDGSVCERFLKMLRPLERSGKIERWSDHEIETGAIWRDEIRRALDRANVALLLVSDAFLASDFIAGNELPQLLAASANRKLRVFWILLSDCLYEETEISNYQAAYPPDQPLDVLSSGEQNRVIATVCRKILKISNVGEVPENRG